MGDGSSGAPSRPPTVRASAAGRHSNKPPDPRRVGAVLPVPHLNGHQIASPALLARTPPSMPGFRCGNAQPPIFVPGEEAEAVHRLVQLATDQALRETRGIQAWPLWPALVPVSPRTCAGCWHAREPGTTGQRRHSRSVCTIWPGGSRP